MGQMAETCRAGGSLVPFLQAAGARSGGVAKAAQRVHLSWWVGAMLMTQGRSWAIGSQRHLASYLVRPLY